MKAVAPSFSRYHSFCPDERQRRPSATLARTPLGKCADWPRGRTSLLLLERGVEAERSQFVMGGGRGRWSRLGEESVPIKAGR